VSESEASCSRGSNSEAAKVAVLNSVEPVVVASAEKEEFVATSWEGKEMDELLKDVKGKGEPSQLHVKSVGNFP